MSKGRRVEGYCAEGEHGGEEEDKKRKGRTFRWLNPRKVRGLSGTKRRLLPRSQRQETRRQQILREESKAARRRCIKLTTGNNLLLRGPSVLDRFTPVYTPLPPLQDDHRELAKHDLRALVQHKRERNNASRLAVQTAV